MEIFLEFYKVFLTIEPLHSTDTSEKIPTEALYAIDECLQVPMENDRPSATTRGNTKVRIMLSLRIYGIASAFIEITTYGACVRSYGAIISIPVQVNADTSNMILEYIAKRESNTAGSM